MVLPDWLNRSAEGLAAEPVGKKQSLLHLSGGRAGVEKTDFFLDTRGFPSSYVII